jgi:hypothetical protein
LGRGGKGKDKEQEAAAAKKVQEQTAGAGDTWQETAHAQENGLYDFIPTASFRNHIAVLPTS